MIHLEDPNRPENEADPLVFHHSATIRGPGFVLVSVGTRIVTDDTVSEYSTSFEHDTDDTSDDDSEDEWELQSDTIL